MKIRPMTFLDLFIGRIPDYAKVLCHLQVAWICKLIKYSVYAVYSRRRHDTVQQ